MSNVVLLYGYVSTHVNLPWDMSLMNLSTTESGKGTNQGVKTLRT